MSRWLDAARAEKSAPTTEDKTDKTDTTPASGAADKVLSVLSVLSEATGAKNEAPPPCLLPATEAARRRAASLPSSPPTCAVCGVADWHVSITEPDGRRLHVACSGLLDGDGVARTPEAIDAVWDAAEALAPILRRERTNNPEEMK